MRVVDSFRQPEYTGENRCTPCTVVNVGIAAGIAVVASLLVGRGVGVGLFVVTVGIVYLRGYLVPGTPTLTKRYLPASVLRLFGKEPLSGATLQSVDADATIRERLVAAGALTDGDDPVLTDAFAEAWEAAIEEVRGSEVGESDLRDLLGTDDISKHAETAAVVDGTQSVRWLSEPAMVADVAAGRVLAARVDGWEAVSPSDRVDLLRGLRLFTRSCPACGGETDLSERTVEPCCDRPRTLVSVACSKCDTALADEAVVGIDEETPARVRAVGG